MLLRSELTLNLLAIRPKKKKVSVFKDLSIRSCQNHTAHFSVRVNKEMIFICNELERPAEGCDKVSSCSDEEYSARRN